MIEIIKRALTDTIYDQELYNKFLDNILTKEEELQILSSGVTDSYVNDGRVNPVNAETMIGMPRLNNFQWCIEQAIENNIEGDIIILQMKLLLLIGQEFIG